MFAYAEGLIVDLFFGREVPAFLRALMLAYKPGLFEVAMINISIDDVLLCLADQSMNVNAHRMIYDDQQLLNQASLFQ